MPGNFHFDGTVSELREQTSKAGKVYGMLVVNDAENSIFEFAVFHENLNFARTLKTGTPVTIGGGLSSRSYQDKNGNDRHAPQLTVRTITVNKKKDEREDDSDDFAVPF